MTAVRTPAAARSAIASTLRAPATMPVAGTLRSSRSATTRRPRLPELAVMTMDMVVPVLSGRGSGRGAAQGEEGDGEDGDGGEAGCHPARAVTRAACALAAGLRCRAA